MRKKGGGHSGDDGGEAIHIPPKIDLPPGVIWPNDPRALPKLDEELIH